MENLKWDDSLKIGFSEIDQHHEHLFGLFKKAHDGFANATPNLGPILDELIDYTGYHFKSEEIWMLDKFYPGVEQHKREHSSFLHRLKKMHKSFDSGQEHMSMEILLYLRETIDHILNIDAAFGKFIKESGLLMHDLLQPIDT
jgi:hemerythrin